MERRVLTLEEKKEKVRDFRPIDDIFFEVLADDKAFCQEMLRVLLDDAQLIVEDVIVQSSRRNLYGRSVRLDALCILGNGRKVNIEVQKADNDDHPRRVRLNASVITARDSQTGTVAKDLQDLCVIYISRFDIFDGKKTLYHVDSVVRETGERIEDGLTRIFVNTMQDDGSDAAELMHCFLQKEVDNPKFPVFSKRVHQFKHEEGGVDHMCEIMERYNKLAVDEAVQETTKRVTKEVTKEVTQKVTKDMTDSAIQNMIRFHVPKETILTAYSEEEYERARRNL